MPNLGPASSASRRSFLKSTSATASITALAAAFPGSARAFADSQQVLKVGLVGCGGRGTDAARNALEADPYAHLTAMGDVFEDKLEFRRRSRGRRRSASE
jgi:myo-inositol 2-dehydrogenase/D-chiro-inositol 1-dehydrogenase